MSDVGQSEAHQFTVGFVSSIEGADFIGDHRILVRISEKFFNSGNLIRKAIATHGAQGGQIASFFSGVRQISCDITQIVSNVVPFKARSFCDLQIRGEVALCQQFIDTRRNILPGNDVGGIHITCRIALGEVDAIFTIPGTDPAMIGHDAIAAMVHLLEKRDELLRWLAFGKLADNQLAVMPCVVARPQDMVNVALGNRKGEGRWCALRLIDGCNLFRFRQHREVEKVQLLTVGLNPYHRLQGFLHRRGSRCRRFYRYGS